MQEYICQYCLKTFVKKRRSDFLNHENRCPQNKDRKYKNGMLGKAAWSRGLTAKDSPSLLRPSLYSILTKSVLNDDGKLPDRYFNKEVNATKEGINFELSQQDFLQLLSDAGLRSSDLGIDRYHLARFGDKGPYKVGNCEFVHYLKNLGDKKISDKMRSAGSKNIRAWNNRNKANGV